MSNDQESPDGDEIPKDHEIPKDAEMAEEEPMSEEEAEKVDAAVAELFDVICKELTTEQGINIETAIAAAGWLTGSALLVASNIDMSELEPGSPILVDAVDEAGPNLIGYIGSMLTESGVDVSEIAEEVPPQHQPVQSFLEISTLLTPEFYALLERHGLPSDTGVLVGAQTTAHFVYAGRELIEPSIAMGLAVTCIVTGAKTVPGRAQSADDSQQIVS